ncbi:acyltransferase [Hymenobacter sp. UV11]|uniref:acyltransferase family protein n=1 Tax=Hymenobacter sp. UV11 TaxID=1849735 RepID=UPI00105DE747|nr:acyltransferase [Hymenobacter sp. UV11]TDN39442.1 hypothetical protein A8B98_19580 [Hymenobacter sp. UV11]TFZ65467.1 acyltransferase [Hymenobacter sp. UV11]
MNHSKKYFPALTGIRAIAAYMVFVFHFNPFRSFANEPDTISSKLFSLCDELHIGVTLFFVLSGFLITLRYQGNVQLTRPWLTHYALNRFSRIFPMYAIALGITLVVVGLRIDYDFIKQHIFFPPINKFASIFLNLTLLKGFFSNLKFAGIAQSWSLTAEECFYFTVPFVLVGNSRLLRRTMLYVAASLAIGLFLTGIGASINYYGFFANLDFLFSYTFFGRCLEFALGMLLAYSLNAKQRFYFKHFTLIGVIGIFILLIALTFYHKKTWQGVVLNNCILPIAICSLFLGLIQEHTYLRKILETKLFNLLGKSSYTFYLIHMGVIQLLIARHISQNKWVYFLLLNALAILLYKLVEEPCHKALKKLGRLPDVSASPAIPAHPTEQ